MTRVFSIAMITRAADFISRLFYISLSAFALLESCAPSSAAEFSPFTQAEPLWPDGREKERNLTVGFTASFEQPRQGMTWLRLTGATLYRVFLNGTFISHGPARGPHGFFRVDELNLTDRLTPGINRVAIEVAGYNANSYYLLDQPSFLQAEISNEGRVLAATGGKAPFVAQVLPGRLQKVQRYSFQRPFSEAYRLSPDWANWRNGPAGQPAKPAIQPKKNLVPRRVGHPDYFLRQPATFVAEGNLRTGLKVSNPWKDRSLTDIGPKLAGYPQADLETTPSLEIQSLANASIKPLPLVYAVNPGFPLEKDQFRVLDFGCNLTGFLGQRVSCEVKTRLIVTFDEILSDGDVDFKRLGCVNVVTYELAPGAYDLETFEPYTLRFLKLMVLEGACKVQSVHLREFACPGVGVAEFASSDERLNRLFAAGRETFRQNSLDIFMDCPSRERAGWLCDSYFTARVAKDLCGNTAIEKNFFENFLLPARFEHLPEGMLPMCYPADHNDGVFIPNWALWFVVELEEYWQRSGDREMVDALRGRVLNLFEYFQRFRNSDGLLEKLESWVFVEWSAANSFVQDVNYPSNMLFARALVAAGRMYNLPDLVRDGEKTRGTIRAQSFDGRFFVDNAVRRDSKLEVTTNRTEVCQYFAFFFDVATPESHPDLWQRLRRDFGPQRKQTKKFPEVHPANAFVGNVLRLELLSRAGLTQQLLDESLAYQLHMAERTGTLWENDGAYASCNHGFASHGGVHVLYRDVLGLREIDPVTKRVLVRFTDNGLQWCRGQVQTPHGPVALNWRKVDGKLRYDVSAPAGYNVEVQKTDP
jgi:alpha-L-rhamnosidase